MHVFSSSYPIPFPRVHASRFTSHRHSPTSYEYSPPSRAKLNIAASVIPPHFLKQKFHMFTRLVSLVLTSAPAPRCSSRCSFAIISVLSLFASGHGARALPPAPRVDIFLAIDALVKQLSLVVHGLPHLGCARAKQSTRRVLWCLHQRHHHTQV